ncbi:hypothetical protein [Haematobacter missouriensis]|uniref:Uncharacterized protein n=1 Tax=Haematobacter missouriensis TaxID=366616 RepID=A0ABX3ZVT7_9RHOB|nr:hypothetical protein [Haematobacter missouriensis]OWJ77990.1 hypothetical protein CDV53_04550 [Haematobacter missouriensis]
MNVQTSDHHDNTACHPRLEARPVARLRHPGSGQLIGLVYQWNTGETQMAWFGQESREFETEPLT